MSVRHKLGVMDVINGSSIKDIREAISATATDTVTADFVFVFVHTCIIMGRRGLVRTLSSMRSSNKFTVEACSIIDSGVVKTMERAVVDAEENVDLCIVRCCCCLLWSRS